MAETEHTASTEARGGDHYATPTAWGFEPSGWVALAMIAVFLVMWRMKAFAMVGSMLDGRIAEIRKQLDEASRLRAEAEALKAEYEKKLAGAADDAALMRAGAEDESKLIVEKAKADATALIARRQKMAEDKIAAAEIAAVAELRARAAQAATSAAGRLIADQHGAAADKKLVDEAIAGI